MFNALEAAKSHSHVLLFFGILREPREGQRGYREKDSFPSTVSFVLSLFKLLSVKFYPNFKKKLPPKTIIKRKISQFRPCNSIALESLIERRSYLNARVVGFFWSTAHVGFRPSWPSTSSMN